MKKEINICFTNFWGNFNPNKNFFTEVLRKYYKINVINDYTDNNIEILFSSTFGYPVHEDIKEKYIKVYFTPENDFPDLNIYDYAITMFDFNHERHIRLPHWLWYHYYRENDVDRVYKNKFINNPSFSEELFNNRWDSIGMVISNGNARDDKSLNIINNIWNNFYMCSGGLWKNSFNGNPVADKLEFLKSYRASIAFENSIQNGYVTEKLYEAFVANTIPIYYGDSKWAKKDFNKYAFIDVNDYPDSNDYIKEINLALTNKDYFLEKINTPRFIKYNEYMSKIEEFLINIVENGKIYNHTKGRLSCRF